MFQDRRIQFVERLEWPLPVDQNGFERDIYDAMNPLYVIFESVDGLHEASLRLLPTDGPTMINDYFADALDGREINQPDTWECTRFCISPNAHESLATGLLAATGCLMAELRISHLVAVFDKLMRVQYRRSRVAPTLLGSMETREGIVFAGQWNFEETKLSELLRMAQIDPLAIDLAIANMHHPELYQKRTA